MIRNKVIVHSSFIGDISVSRIVFSEKKIKHFSVILFLLSLITSAHLFLLQAQPDCGEWHWIESTISKTGQTITPQSEEYNRVAVIVFNKVYEYRDTVLTSIRQIGEYTFSGDTLIYSAEVPVSRTEKYSFYMHGINGNYFPDEIIDSALTEAKRLTGSDFSYTLWSAAIKCDYLSPTVFCRFNQYYRGLKVINGQVNLEGTYDIPIKWVRVNDTFLTEKDAISITPRISSEQALTIAQSDTSLVTYNSYYVIDAQTAAIIEHDQECSLRCINATCPCGPVLPDLEPKLVIYNGRLAYEFRISKTTAKNDSKLYHRNQSSKFIQSATGLTMHYYCESNMMVQADIFELDGKIHQKIYSGYQVRGQHTLFYGFDRYSSRTLPHRTYLFRIRLGNNEMVHRFINF